MPLTDFQREVLHVLAARRSPESHIAGGLVLNRAPDSPRYSKDVDIFHDSEVRDCIDLLHLHRTYLTVGALCWAGSGKDPGLTPWLRLDLAKRNAKYPQEALRGELLARPIDLVELKHQLLDAADAALSLFDRLPAEEIGCLYLDAAGKPVTPIQTPRISTP